MPMIMMMLMRLLDQVAVFTYWYNSSIGHTARNGHGGQCHEEDFNNAELHDEDACAFFSLLVILCDWNVVSSVCVNQKAPSSRRMPL